MLFIFFNESISVLNNSLTHTFSLIWLSNVLILSILYVDSMFLNTFYFFYSFLIMSKIALKSFCLSSCCFISFILMSFCYTTSCKLSIKRVISVYLESFSSDFGLSIGALYSSSVEMVCIAISVTSVVYMPIWTISNCYKSSLVI